MKEEERRRRVKTKKARSWWLFIDTFTHQTRARLTATCSRKVSSVGSGKGKLNYLLWTHTTTTTTTENSNTTKGPRERERQRAQECAEDETHTITRSWTWQQQTNKYVVLIPDFHTNTNNDDISSSDPRSVFEYPKAFISPFFQCVPAQHAGPLGTGETRALRTSGIIN